MAELAFRVSAATLRFKPAIADDAVTSVVILVHCAKSAATRVPLDPLFV